MFKLLTNEFPVLKKSIAFLPVVFGSLLLLSSCASSESARLSFDSIERRETLGFSQAGMSALDDGMKEYVESGRVAGLVTLLARNGQVVSFNAYGQNDLAARAPMTRDKIFRIHSMTKPVIAAALMILYDEGEWKLDDPITDYMPEFRELKVFSGVDENGAMIVEEMKRAPTMRELLTHTAGFGYGLIPTNPVEVAFQQSGLIESTSLQDMIERIDHIPLQFQPGERWAYSIASDLQGRVIEKISGMSLSEFLNKRMFGPLGMNDTGFYAPAEKVDRLAELYYWDAETASLKHIGPDSPFAAYILDNKKPPALESGGGGLLSTAADYARFAQMVLNRGKLNGVRVLKPETVDLMISDQLPADMPLYLVSEGDFGVMRYGLGWGVINDPERMGVDVGAGAALWGGAAGTWFWIDPANDIVFVGMVQCFMGGCDTAGGALSDDERFFSKSANLVGAALTEDIAE